MKILLLEDDPVLQEIIEEFLTERHHEVVSYYDGEAALEAIRKGGFEFLLLDVNVPNINGFELLAYLRDIGSTLPAIFITSLPDIKDLKKGFAIGADDYLRKPFELEELQARIDHVAKQYQLSGEVRFGQMRFCPNTHQLYRGDQPVELCLKESVVLEYLIKHKGRVVSCDELIVNLWDDEHSPTHATIRTYIKNLRKLFDSELYITNIKGEGYRFDII